MDTETPGTASPAPDTGSPNPTTAPTTQPAGGAQPGTTAPEFAVPDAYKDRGWAGKVKSIDDVYKQLDNLDTLAGKKTVGAIDYNTATPEEIAAHHAKLAPADKAAYKFGEGSDEAFSNSVRDTFAKLGINEYQGNELIKEITGIAKGISDQRVEADTSMKGYEELSKKAFGDDFKKTISAVENTIKAYTSDEEKAVFDNLGNADRIAIDKLVYKLSQGYEARIAKILDEHGVKETGAQGEGGGGGSPSQDVATLRSNIRQKMRDLELRPHTAAEKETLQKQLNDLLPKG